IDHRHPPRLGVEKRQAQHDNLRGGTRGEGAIMRLAEIDGKALLRRHGIAVPRSVLLGAGGGPPAGVGRWAGRLLQGPGREGGRGKRGLVRRLGDLTELASTRQRIAALVSEASGQRGHSISARAGHSPEPGSSARASALGDVEAPILLEEAVAIAREIYL